MRGHGLKKLAIRVFLKKAVADHGKFLGYFSVDLRS